MKLTPTDVPTSTSTDTEWLQWYKDLKRYFGKKTANTVFDKAWTKRGSEDANTNQLRSYLSDNGYEIKTGTLGKLTDNYYNVLDTVGGVFKAGKVVIIVGTVVGTIGIVYIIYKILKNPKKSAELAASIHPAGRAALVAKTVMASKGGSQ